MRIFEEIKQYLPKYLSDDALEDLFKNLKDFPRNINEIYSGSLYSESDVLQGDGLRKMPVVNLPDPTVVEGPVMVLSNTCDTSFQNNRSYSPTVIYCPVVKLEKHLEILREAGVTEEKLELRSEQIRKQRLSDIFYLPKFGHLPEDCIALLSHINSCDISYLTPDSVIEKRLFALSNYGLYLFLFKLSIHLTRIREQIDRNLVT
jgi:hypothetical protein